MRTPWMTLDDADFPECYPLSYIYRSPFGNDPFGPAALGVCVHGVRRFFDVPKSARRIKLVLTKRPTPTSIEFKIGPENLLGNRRSFKIYDKPVMLTYNISKWLADAFDQGHKYIGVEYE